MKTIFLFAILLLMISCKKNAIVPNFLNGKWVENTLRADTIDFTINERVDATGTNFEFKSRVFTDSSTLPFTIVHNNTIFTYQLIPDSIVLKNWLSSNSNGVSYNFNLAADNLSFTIQKFYYRPSLPTGLVFVKL